MDNKLKIQVFAAGSGGSGILLQGNLSDYNSFEEVKLTNFKKIKINGMFGLYFSSNRELFYWGQSSLFSDSKNDVITYIPKQIQLQHQIKTFSCGWQHSLIVTSNNKLFGFGSNKFCELGIDIRQTFINLIEIPNNEIITKVVCGFRQSYFINEKFEVYGCGSNKQNEVMNTKVDFLKQFTKIEGLENIVKIKCGQRFCLAKDIKNKLYQWGNNNFGQLGSQIDDIEDFDAGWSHHIILRKSKPFLQICGRGDFGQQGDGMLQHNLNYIPLDQFFQIPNFESIRSVKCGSESTYIIIGEDIYVTGWNEHGNLLQENKNHVSKFIKINTNVNNIKKLKCRGAICFAIK